MNPLLKLLFCLLVIAHKNLPPKICNENIVKFGTSSILILKKKKKKEKRKKEGVLNKLKQKKFVLPSK